MIFHSRFRHENPFFRLIILVFNILSKNSSHPCYAWFYSTFKFQFYHHDHSEEVTIYSLRNVDHVLFYRLILIGISLHHFIVDMLLGTLFI